MGLGSNEQTEKAKSVADPGCTVPVNSVLMV